MLDAEDQPDTFLHGRRHPWAATPEPVQGWVAERLGEPIVSSTDLTGGMSTGVAALVHGARHSLFVKGVDADDNPVAAKMYAREAAAAARLPRRPEIPALLASSEIETEHGRWVLNLFPALTGRPVRHPWLPADLIRVMDSWQRVAPTLHSTPYDVSASLSAFFVDWGTIAADPTDLWHGLARHWVDREARMAALVDGSDDEPPVLSHIDLRADNIVLADPPGTEVWFVDWAHPGLAARWVDVALLLADVIGSGADRSTGGPIDVLEVWRSHPSCAGHDPELLITVAASLAAALHVRARRDPHPALPHRTVWATAMADHLLPFIRQQTRR